MVIRPVGSETPEQFYATERRGSTLKGVLTTVSKDMYTLVRKLRNMSSYPEGHTNLLFDGIPTKKSDMLHRQWPRLWSRAVQLETVSRIAMNHVQVNMDCSGALVLD